MTTLGAPRRLALSLLRWLLLRLLGLQRQRQLLELLLELLLLIEPLLLLPP